jgi:hypothetical protein
MLTPLFQKAVASETVFSVVHSLSGRALIKEVGLSCSQLYQFAACKLQRLCVDFGGIEPRSIDAPIRSAEAHGGSPLHPQRNTVSWRSL